MLSSNIEFLPQPGLIYQQAHERHLQFCHGGIYLSCLFCSLLDFTSLFLYCPYAPRHCLICCLNFSVTSCIPHYLVLMFALPLHSVFLNFSLPLNLVGFIWFYLVLYSHSVCWARRTSVNRPQ